MQNHDWAKVTVKAREDIHSARTLWRAAALPLAGAALILGMSALTSDAQDVGEDGLIHSYGISTFGELRYGIALLPADKRKTELQKMIALLDSMGVSINDIMGFIALMDQKKGS